MTELEMRASDRSFSRMPATPPASEQQAIAAADAELSTSEGRKGAVMNSDARRHFL